MLQINSSFTFNKLYWISSKGDADQGLTRRLTEDMNALSTTDGFKFKAEEMDSLVSIEKFFQELVYKASVKGEKPILHFDMHGNKERGLKLDFSNEYISWEKLSSCLRTLNVCTANNLLVVGAACYSLSAILKISIGKPVPYYALLAPQHAITLEKIETSVIHFYRHLFKTGSLDESYKRYLKPEFYYVHCEKLLFDALIGYIRQGCQGKTAQQRRERLLTEGVERGAVSDLKKGRGLIKKSLKPSQRLVDRFASTFLINKPFSLCFEDLEKHLQNTNK